MSENNKSLVRVAVEMGEILTKLAENGGELSEVLEHAFDVTSEQLVAKADSYALFMERLDNEADLWKQKADSYAKVAKSCKALKERLNNNIKAAMQLMETDEIHGEEMRFKLSRLAPKLVIDEVSLPQTWKMQVVEVVPDKDRIKKAVELGESIPGVSQEDSYSLRKYVNARKK
jgi:hypothetical protein